MIETNNTNFNKTPEDEDVFSYDLMRFNLYGTLKPDLPQQIVEYRNLWDERIKGISKESKEKIKETVGNMNVMLLLDRIDKSRYIFFRAWDKNLRKNVLYKFLDPLLDTYKNPNNGGLFRHVKYNSIRPIDQYYPIIEGISGDNKQSGTGVQSRKNYALSNFVNYKNYKGLYLPETGKTQELLQNLGNKAELNDISDQIAMLMYLTGIDGEFFVDFKDGTPSAILSSNYIDRNIYPLEEGKYHIANLLMFSKK